MVAFHSESRKVYGTMKAAHYALLVLGLLWPRGATSWGTSFEENTAFRACQANPTTCYSLYARSLAAQGSPLQHPTRLRAARAAPATALGRGWRCERRTERFRPTRCRTHVPLTRRGLSPLVFFFLLFVAPIVRGARRPQRCKRPVWLVPSRAQRRDPDGDWIVEQPSLSVRPRTHGFSASAPRRPSRPPPLTHCRFAVCRPRAPCRDIRCNNIYGSIPTELGKLKSLTHLSVTLSH